MFHGTSLTTIIIPLIITAIILIISITVHEYAHARASDKLGDPTPRMQQRLTLNPLAHIDPLWLILVFLVWFGRGRAVQINPRYYKHPLRDELLVALAWPIANIILTIIGIIILLMYEYLFLGVNATLSGAGDIASQFRVQFCLMNIALAVFNMIPMPPLDGYRIIKIFFPDTISRIEPYGQYILLGFVVLFIRWPGKWVLSDYITSVSSAIFNIFYALFSFFFR